MRIKKSIVTKDVGQYVLNTEMNLTHKPKAGDVAVFEVIEIDRHSNVQLDDKRLAWIFEGDYIMATFADRYATAQFEGYVPKQPLELYDILGAGGAIGVVHTKNASLEHREPTKVKLVGYCCDQQNQVINTKFYNKERHAFAAHVPGDAKIILSIGSTMDSGKTTTAAFVARGLKTTGKTVCFIKMTGTCYTKDKDMVLDCGADYSYDFSDMGFPSTYMCEKNDLLDMYQSLLLKVGEHKPDYIVMEIADGILQRETAFLLRDEAFMSTIHNVVFSCGDSLAALQGVDMLEAIGIKPCLISGRFTMSPLLINEVHEQSGMPVFTIEQLMTGEHNSILLDKKVVVA
ncbi:MAG: hypothetical protein ACKVOK_11475 [Flavobacteriales bacterium]